MEKLKPCPFCGSEAELGHTEKDSEYGETAFVYCTNCGANGKMIEISPKYGADEKAIESWNRRIEDVRENITANWIHVYYYRPSTNSYDIEMGKCSNCNHEYSYDAETGISFEDYKFCPECGAKIWRMRGKPR